MTSNLVFFEGKIVPESEAKISVLSPALARGPIPYETLRGYRNDEDNNLYLFRLPEHLRRLEASMKILRFQELFTREALTDWIMDVVRANKLVGDMHVRIMVYPLDAEGPGRTSKRSGIVIDAHARPARARAPVSCQVSSWVRRGAENQPARVKVIGLRMLDRVALAQATLDGYSDVIFQDDRGKIAEAMISNVFIVRRGILATPAITEQILEGITRDTILALAPDLGIPCVERPVDRTELYDCEEAFLCSTGLELLPIVSVDGIPVGKGTGGEITDRIRKAYLSAVRGSGEGRRDWLTPVY